MCWQSVTGHVLHIQAGLLIAKPLGAKGDGTRSFRDREVGVNTEVSTHSCFFINVTCVPGSPKIETLSIMFYVHVVVQSNTEHTGTLFS